MTMGPLESKASEIARSAHAGQVDKAGEDYLADYVPRIARNTIDREAKLADLSHNMDLSRLPEVSDKDCERVRKDERAREILLAAGAGKDCGVSGISELTISIGA